MKILIAGLGSIGRRHLKNLVTLGEKDIILLRNKKSTLSDDELKGFAVETDVNAALRHKPDAVIVSNPTSMHLDVAIPAAKAGCHILLEKPIAGSLDRLDELAAAVEKSKSRVLVGFQYRFHPTLRTIAELISKSAIGKPVSVCSRWGEYLPNWHPWEDYHNSYAARPELGGGVVLTLCHPFDYLSWLLGKPSLEWASMGNTGALGITVEETADVCLRFPGGALGTVHLDYLQRPVTHTLEIIGTEGTIRWDNSDGKLSVYKNNGPQWEYFMPPQGFERNSMFLDQIRHFIDVVKGKAKPVCTLQDGIDALEIVLGVRNYKK